MSLRHQSSRLSPSCGSSRSAPAEPPPRPPRQPAQTLSGQGPARAPPHLVSSASHAPWPPSLFLGNRRVGTGASGFRERRHLLFPGFLHCCYFSEWGLLPSLLPCVPPFLRKAPARSAGGPRHSRARLIYSFYKPSGWFWCMLKWEPLV